MRSKLFIASIALIAATTLLFHSLSLKTRPVPPNLQKGPDWIYSDQQLLRTFDAYTKIEAAKSTRARWFSMLASAVSAKHAQGQPMMETDIKFLFGRADWSTGATDGSYALFYQFDGFDRKDQTVVVFFSKLGLVKVIGFNATSAFGGSSSTITPATRPTSAPTDSKAP